MLISRLSSRYLARCMQRVVRLARYETGKETNVKNGEPCKLNASAENSGAGSLNGAYLRGDRGGELQGFQLRLCFDQSFDHCCETYRWEQNKTSVSERSVSYYPDAVFGFTMRGVGNALTISCELPASCKSELPQQSPPFRGRDRAIPALLSRTSLPCPCTSHSCSQKFQQSGVADLSAFRDIQDSQTGPQIIANRRQPNI